MENGVLYFEAGENIIKPDVSTTDIWHNAMMRS